jgi:hypothetical protein
VIFEETEEGLVLKPAADVEDSAGVLSGFGESGEVLEDLLKDRGKRFR